MKRFIKYLMKSSLGMHYFQKKKPVPTIGGEGTTLE